MTVSEPKINEAEWVEVEPIGKIVVCDECGKRFKGRINKYGKHVSRWDQLAGHILRRRDHYNKRWALKYLKEHKKKTGLR